MRFPTSTSTLSGGPGAAPCCSRVRTTPCPTRSWGDSTRASANVVAFRLYGFPVPDFGAYLFEVHHGDERLAQVPFWVMPADIAPVPGAPEPGELE